MARILIVDDSPTDVQSLRSMLEKAGHIAIDVSSAQAAMDKVRNDKPDVVLMDVMLPGINGFQATRTLSKDPATAHIPIIVISSKDHETDRVWALRQGAREYLVKPVSHNDLLNKINSVVGR